MMSRLPTDWLTSTRLLLSWMVVTLLTGILQLESLWVLLLDEAATLLGALPRLF